MLLRSLAYKLFKQNSVLAAIAGTLTNTVGVLGLATLRGYLPAKVSLSVGFVHGIPEIIVAALLIAVLVKALKKLAY